jgi:hypothetical protein
MSKELDSISILDKAGLSIFRIGWDFNVRPCLALGILIIQIAMIADSIWNLPLRSISHIGVAFT